MSPIVDLWVALRLDLEDYWEGSAAKGWWFLAERLSMTSC